VGKGTVTPEKGCYSSDEFNPEKPSVCTVDGEGKEEAKGGGGIGKLSPSRRAVHFTFK